MVCVQNGPQLHEKLVFTIQNWLRFLDHGLWVYFSLGQALKPLI